MSKIGIIKVLVRSGLYYLTIHADEEAMNDDFDIYDIENSILNGKIIRVWPRDSKYEIAGPALDHRIMGVVCRITLTGKVRIITVYEYKN